MMDACQWYKSSPTGPAEQDDGGSLYWLLVMSKDRHFVVQGISPQARGASPPLKSHFSGSSSEKDLKHTFRDLLIPC